MQSFAYDEQVREIAEEIENYTSEYYDRKGILNPTKFELQIDDAHTIAVIPTPPRYLEKSEDGRFRPCNENISIIYIKMKSPYDYGWEWYAQVIMHELEHALDYISSGDELFTDDGTQPIADKNDPLSLVYYILWSPSETNAYASSFLYNYIIQSQDNEGFQFDNNGLFDKLESAINQLEQIPATNTEYWEPTVELLPDKNNNGDIIAKARRNFINKSRSKFQKFKATCIKKYMTYRQMKEKGTSL